MCICHDKLRSLNAKGLCPIGSKEAREKSAESKGLTVKKKDDGTDNTRRNATFNARQMGVVNERPKGNVFRQVSDFLPKETKTIKVTFKKTKIKPFSKDKATEVALLAKIKSKKIRELGKKCEMCEKHGEVDLFHIIGVGDKKHSTNPLNLALSCRFCHLVWGANDWGKIVKFKNFDEIMERLKLLDEGKYWKIKHKIDEYYAKSNSV